MPDTAVAPDTTAKPDTTTAPDTTAAPDTTTAADVDSTDLSPPALRGTKIEARFLLKAGQSGVCSNEIPTETAYIDNVRFEGRPECAGTGILDPDFEISGTKPAKTFIWAQTTGAGQDVGFPLQEGGGFAAKMSAWATCEQAALSTMIRVPPAIEGSGPAISFDYLLGYVNPEVNQIPYVLLDQFWGKTTVGWPFETAWGLNSYATQHSPPLTSGWSSVTYCIPWNVGGQVGQLRFFSNGGSGVCGNEFPDVTSWLIDNVVIGLDPECPGL